MYDVAYVMRGSIRKKILRLLETPKTATMLSKEINKHRSSISRALLDLEEKGYLKCLNIKDAMHRFYKLTPKGKELLEKAKSILGD